MHLPPHEKTEPFHEIADFLTQAGLSVPQVSEADHTHGFLFIEDLGTTSYRTALDEGVCEKALYESAIKGLINLHKSSVDCPSGTQDYDITIFLKETSVFIEWYGLTLPLKAKEEFECLWQEAYKNQPQLPQCFVMRDVLIDNLMWLPDRQGHKKCGYIDFQDGLIGPISYDLVSLLEDARRDISPLFAKEMLQIYFERFPELDQDDFWTSYCLWGAQRSTKILGVFSRLAKRDGKSKYLEHIPRVRKILWRDLQHPHLCHLKAWFKEHGALK